MSKKKKKGKKNRMPRYKPIGKAISVEGSIVQASVLLDIAARKAESNGDVSGMGDVATKWLELGTVIHNISTGGLPEGEESDIVSETQIGFRPPAADAVDEEEEMKIGFRGRSNE